jgi:hypothetical protein
MKHNLDKTEKYSIFLSTLFAIGVFLFFLILISCSARTVDKKEDKKDSIAKIDEKMKASTNETINQFEKIDSSSTNRKESEFKSFLEDFEFESVNPDKESSITQNGKSITFKNLKGKKRTQTTNEKNNSLETINLIKIKNKELHRKNLLIMNKNIEIQKLQSQSSKHVEKSPLIPWWLWLLLLIILIIASRVAWLYYKGINPFNWFNNLFKIY